MYKDFSQYFKMKRNLQNSEVKIKYEDEDDMLINPVY